MSLYEGVMNELIFDYNEDEDGDRVTISAIKNGNVVGRVIIGFIFDAYREFEDLIESGEFTEKEYYKIFPNDTFAQIEYLDVVDNEKGKGYAKQLMETAMNHIKSKGESVVYLNASPMGFTGLNINNLVGFYKSFGFQELVDSGHNVEMFKNI